VTVKGVLEVQGLSRNAVYDMLVDHANSHRVFRNVKAVRLTDQGRGVRHMHQSLRWKALVLSGNFSMTLALTEDAANCECRFRKINQTGVIRTMEGAWAVHHASPDRSGLRVMQSFTAELNVPRNRYFQGVTDRVIAQLMRHNMEDVFEELVRLYADPA